MGIMAKKMETTIDSLFLCVVLQDARDALATLLACLQTTIGEFQKLAEPLFRKSQF